MSQFFKSSFNFQAYEKKIKVNELNPINKNYLLHIQLGSTEISSNHDLTEKNLSRVNFKKSNLKKTCQQ